MEENIYQPPKAELHIEDTPSGSMLKGVLFGSITDIVGSLIFGVVFGIMYGIILALQGLSKKEIMAHAEHIELLSPVGLFGIFGGTLISFYAGYLCAKKSGSDIQKATITVSLISCIFGFSLGLSQHSIIENIVLAIVTILAILGGSKLWQLKNA